MKIRSKQYAKALYLSTCDLPKPKAKRVVENFIKLLYKNKDLGLIDKIINEFEEYHKKEKGIINLKIISTVPLDDRLIDKIIHYLGKKRGLVEIERQIDENLLGGIILKYDDLILDGSVKGKLEGLRNKLAY